VAKKWAIFSQTHLVTLRLCPNLRKSRWKCGDDFLVFTKSCCTLRAFTFRWFRGFSLARAETGFSPFFFRIYSLIPGPFEARHSSAVIRENSVRFEHLWQIYPKRVSEKLSKVTYDAKIKSVSTFKQPCVVNIHHFSAAFAPKSIFPKSDFWST
jgi:hypothetical protein